MGRDLLTSEALGAIARFVGTAAVLCEKEMGASGVGDNSIQRGFVQEIVVGTVMTPHEMALGAVGAGDGDNQRGLVHEFVGDDAGTRGVVIGSEESGSLGVNAVGFRYDLQIAREGEELSPGEGVSISKKGAIQQTGQSRSGSSPRGMSRLSEDRVAFSSPLVSGDAPNVGERIGSLSAIGEALINFRRQGDFLWRGL